MNEDAAGNVIDENSVGITKQLARINLTLNHYTEWYWKINLNNLMHFLALCADPQADCLMKAHNPSQTSPGHYLEHYYYKVNWYVPNSRT